MRYAVSEKAVLEQKSTIAKLEKKLEDKVKDAEILQHKVAQNASEKERLCQMYDQKCYELKTSQIQIRQLKSDVSALETKVKWAQNNLKLEIDLRKESEGREEVLNGKLQEALSQIEDTKKDAQEAIHTFQNSQENRAQGLDVQVKEQQATLITLRHEKEDREHQIKSLQAELERLQTKQKETLHENNELSLKLQQLERERSENDQKIRELKGSADQQRLLAADVNSMSTKIEQLKLQLET